MITVSAKPPTAAKQSRDILRSMTQFHDGGSRHPTTLGCPQAKLVALTVALVTTFAKVVRFLLPRVLSPPEWAKNFSAEDTLQSAASSSVKIHATARDLPGERVT